MHPLHIRLRHADSVGTAAAGASREVGGAPATFGGHRTVTKLLHYRASSDSDLLALSAAACHCPERTDQAELQKYVVPMVPV
jgi:hypothetical protein